MRLLYNNFGGIMNYEDLVFSEKLAQQRITQAENISTCAIKIIKHAANLNSK